MEQPVSEVDLDRDWLIVGTVVKPHGVHGDLAVEAVTDFPERLREGVRFGLGDLEGPLELHEAHRVRPWARGWLVSVKGLRDRDAAEAWRGKSVYLPELSREERPPGYYYEHELVGLRCHSPAGLELGVVVGLDHGPGQSRLVVEVGGVEHLVPWVPTIVKQVDLERCEIVLDPPLGLLE